MGNILIVDDEKSIRITLREFLLNEGHKVTVAEDADTAMKVLENEDIDVVMTDIIMPRVTGVDLLKTLRRASPYVQVIMITGEPTLETATESLRAGAFDYIAKPVTKDLAVKTVSNAMKVKTLGDEKRRLEADNLRHREELETLVKELEAFTYSVSHDLRAPLRHINAFSKILRDKYKERLPDDGTGYLDKIINSASYMQTLIDALLNLSRLGRKELMIRTVELNKIISAVKAELAPDIEGREIEWHIEKIPEVPCDPALMKIVFTNLLSNAVKFTSNSGDQTVITIKPLPDEKPGFMVQDNGVGFNMKYADKLFGVFQRMHRKSAFEGVGVGLATVQRIVARHKGRIYAESEVNKGAIFFIELSQK
ncbi:response regulator [Desulfococcaceae bacterium HSG7]|nr:response regulator [Desulfococcaceae bacterium HSG9]MDM8556087.1 response regulator [Desulfococcaceae bacterium HSG7]